jgi:hypothetical protein
MSLQEEQNTHGRSIFPHCKENSGLVDSSVTPSLNKGNGGSDRFIDEELFVDDRKPSSMPIPC